MTSQERYARMKADNQMTERPLFIPLKREFYEQFVSGEKDTEYRLYGKRWNERTCRLGRDVTLSLGYGKAHRTPGTITGFAAPHLLSLGAEIREDITACYGRLPATQRIACIAIRAIQAVRERGIRP